MEVCLCMCVRVCTYTHKEKGDPAFISTHALLLILNRKAVSWGVEGGRMVK